MIALEQKRRSLLLGLGSIGINQLLVQGVLPAQAAAVVRQIVVSLHLQDIFLFGARSSVWDCRLIRRPAKDARSEDTNRPRPGYKQKRLVIRKWLLNLRCHRITMV